MTSIANACHWADGLGQEKERASSVSTVHVFCAIAERDILILTFLCLVQFDLNSLQPLQAMWLFLGPSERIVWRALPSSTCYPKLWKSCKALTFLIVTRHISFTIFLPDKFLTFLLGKNHRKKCQGKNYFTVVLFSYGKFFSSSPFIFRSSQARIFRANYFVLEWTIDIKIF